MHYFFKLFKNKNYDYNSGVILGMASVMQSIKNFFDEYLSNFYIPKSLHVSNVFEIIILAVLIYEFIAWVKTTRAFTLLKGIIVLLIFWLLAYIFNFTTILWLGGKIINFAIIA